MTSQYKLIIQNLLLEIDNKHESRTKFCKDYNICRYNLSRIANLKQVITVGLFTYLMDCLTTEALFPKRNECSILLTEYLVIDSTKINYQLLKILSS